MIENTPGSGTPRTTCRKLKSLIETYKNFASVTVTTAPTDSTKPSVRQHPVTNMANIWEPYFGLQSQSLSWAITLCASSAFLLFGYDQGVLGSIISSSDFLRALGISRDDPNTLSTIVSIYDIGVSLHKPLRYSVWTLMGSEYGRMPCCCDLGWSLWP